MVRERDLQGYGRQRPDIVWPNGARIAVSLVVNFEEGAELSVEQGDAETEPYGEVQSTQAPGVRDLVQEQVFNYGMQAGLWRFLDSFAEGIGVVDLASLLRAVACDLEIATGKLRRLDALQDRGQFRPGIFGGPQAGGSCHSNQGIPAGEHGHDSY